MPPIVHIFKKKNLNRRFLVIVCVLCVIYYNYKNRRWSGWAPNAGARLIYPLRSCVYVCVFLCGGKMMVMVIKWMLVVFSHVLLKIYIERFQLASFLSSFLQQILINQSFRIRRKKYFSLYESVHLNVATVV